MNISVVGMGHVGLITGACLATYGHQVTGVDANPELVARINSGQMPLYEPGLESLVTTAVTRGRLRVTEDLRSAVLESEVTFICVGGSGGPNGVGHSQVVEASRGVGTVLARKSGYHVVAVKSTVLPGTTEDVVQKIIEARSGRRLGATWGLCVNPEFFRTGQAVAEFLTPDRLVIGASDERAAAMMLQLYEHCNCPRIVTTPRAAELIKYVTNSLLATLVSFSNEVANLCMKIPGLDAREIWHGVHLDRRLKASTQNPQQPVGVTEYLWHGLGFGGSYLPNDVSALREFGRRLGGATRLLDAVATINASQPLQVVSLLKEEMELEGSTVAILGLAFKPGTEDLHESPALPVIAALIQHGASVIVHDPVAMHRAREQSLFDNVTFASHWGTALREADACCIITAWPEYRAIQPEDFRTLMRRPLVIDGRGMFSPEALTAAGVTWRGIGYTPRPSGTTVGKEVNV
jgi:UDPglucose 6-dehydrogenase